MNEFDTYTAFVKVTYSVPRDTLEPGEQALQDQQLYVEDLGELLLLMRRGFEDETVEVVVVHDSVDSSDPETEMATIRDRFGVEDFE